MNPPRVFVSYSHDSAEHKKWVLDFSTTLRNRGIDAVLDQWDLKPGDDLPHFMETQLETADFVLMICTEKYVEKANSGEGGVGYEKMIMTSSLLTKIDSSKVIPVVRQSGTNIRPTFMQSKLYVDFSKNEDNEYSFDNLLRTLLGSPLYEKPDIGKNPFKPMEDSAPDRMADGLKELMKVIATCYENNSFDYVNMDCIVAKSSMHRLTLQKYLDISIQNGLLRKNKGSFHVFITESGVNYLMLHGVIES